MITVTSPFSPKPDIGSIVLDHFKAQRPSGLLPRLIRTVTMDGLRNPDSKLREDYGLKRRIDAYERLYDLAVGSVKRELAEPHGGEVYFGASITVNDDGSSYCFGSLVFEREMPGSWIDVPGWFKPPLRDDSKPTVIYEMDGGEPWSPAEGMNGAKISVITPPIWHKAGYELRVFAHPKYFADAMTVAVMLAGAAPIQGSSS